MSKKAAIQRKEVHLDTETIIALTTQAIRAGKSLKPYMEDVLIAQSLKARNNGVMAFVPAKEQ